MGYLMVDEICIKLRRIIERNNLLIEKNEFVKGFTTDSTALKMIEKVGEEVKDQNETIAKDIALLMEFSCK